MKKLLALTLIAGTAVGLASACAPTPANVLEQKHEDGTYRGNFFDKTVHQVGVEFTIEGGIVKSASFRQLLWNNCDFSKADIAAAGSTCSKFGAAGDAAAEAAFKKAGDNFKAALAYTVNKPVTAFADLEKGSDIIAGATAEVRFNKIRFALIDGLLHGKYE